MLVLAPYCNMMCPNVCEASQKSYVMILRDVSAIAGVI